MAEREGFEPSVPRKVQQIISLLLYPTELHSSPLKRVPQTVYAVQLQYWRTGQSLESAPLSEIRVLQFFNKILVPLLLALRKRGILFLIHSPRNTCA